MAEIHIQRNQGPPIVPILLGVLALVAVAAVIWWLMSRDGTGDATPAALTQDTVMEAPAGAAAAAPQEVQAFREQCGQAGQFRDQMALEHEHVAGCMRQLAEGRDAVIRRDQVGDQPLQQRLQTFRQRADQITQDPQATDHANRVRGAAMEASEIIQYMAQNRQAAGANLQQHAQQTRQAAEAMDAATPLLEQQERTSRFFTAAADALEAMARSQQGQSWGGQTPGGQPR
jgi:hypothetical protein